MNFWHQPGRRACRGHEHPETMVDSNGLVAIHPRVWHRYWQAAGTERTSEALM